MILKGLVSVPELAMHSGYHHTRYVKNQFEGKTYKINGVNYIPKIYLTSKRDLEAAKKCTVLDDYLPLAYCANHLLGRNKRVLESKVKFQKLTKQKIYDIKKINANYFIKIPKDLQEKIDRYSSYSVSNFQNFKEYEDVKDSYIFGDEVIVFV